MRVICTCLTDCLAHSGIRERIISTARTVASADMVARGSTPLPKLRPRVPGTGSACVPKQKCYRGYVVAWPVTMIGNSLGHLIKGRPPPGPCTVGPLPSPSLSPLLQPLYTQTHTHTPLSSLSFDARCATGPVARPTTQKHTHAHTHVHTRTHAHTHTCFSYRS